ncbi:hypothetical protein F442_01979 [Phytophthora nicotianae P10297]|uniref:Uncharacterized protein n=2 Tax=Phytophthora nicotianae TaxID=4792 RepID=W3A1L4_PHYNI|nr:hypothetical protein F442_01979 [Phytophthora nicotianae P10297]
METRQKESIDARVGDIGLTMDGWRATKREDFVWRVPREDQVEE